MNFRDHEEKRFYQHFFGDDAPAGWCTSCGRRRRDENGCCPNCDNWWNAPLVQAGGPLVLAALVLLALVIQALRPLAAPTAATTAPLLSVAAATPTPFGDGGAAAFHAARPRTAAVFFTPPPAPPPPPLNPETRRWAEHERLRQACAYADAVVAAADQAQTSRPRRLRAADLALPADATF